MLWVLVGWTALVWVGRISNILDDPDQSAAQAALPSVMLVLAALAGARALTGRPRLAGLVLAGATIGVWALRLPLLAAGDHSGGFIAVHATLAAVSIALAALVLRAERRLLDSEDPAGGEAGSGELGSAVTPEPDGEARRG